MSRTIVGTSDAIDLETAVAAARRSARALFQSALDKKAAALGPDSPALADDLSNLGNVLAEQGDLVAARAPHSSGRWPFNARRSALTTPTWRSPYRI